MKTEQKSHIIASFGTLVTLAGVLALLWFVYIGVPEMMEDEGIVVAFGQESEGQGVQPEPQPMPVPPTESVVSQPATESQPAREDYITQEDEEALALAEQKKREEAEKERKRQQAIAKAQAMGALFGAASEPTTGSGTTVGEQQAGNVTGTANTGQNTYSLAGRSLIGKLPLPAKDYNSEGIVVINISVDKEGKVVNASVGRGTNTGDDHLLQSAKAAALKAQFSPTDKPTLQMGTITYIFKLN